MLYIDIHKYVIHTYIYNKLYIYYHLYGIPLLSSSKFFCRLAGASRWSLETRGWDDRRLPQGTPPGALHHWVKRAEMLRVFFFWVDGWHIWNLVGWFGILEFLSEKNGSLEVDSDTDECEKGWSLGKGTLVGIAVICSFIQMDTAGFMFIWLRQAKRLSWIETIVKESGSPLPMARHPWTQLSRFSCRKTHGKA